MSETAGKAKGARAAKAETPESEAPEAEAPESAPTEDSSAEEAVDDAATPQEEDAQQPRISRERLVAEARAFTGYPSHVIAGALASAEGDDFTADRARELAEAWLASPVAADNGPEEV